MSLNCCYIYEPYSYESVMMTQKCELETNWIYETRLQ